MTWLAPVTLVGNIATLAPLSPEHHDALVEAVQDGELWNLWYTTIPQPKDMRKFIDKRMGLDAPDTHLGFVAVENCSQKIVGMTNYMNASRENRRLEIGGTWYSRRMQRTALNTECKLLLLTHAFETLGCIAVEFRTHFLNHQSRQAIERLGAKLDGILRNHQVSADGVLRDTCVYSIIAAEWPTVRTHLHWQLRKPRVAAKTGR